jgi:hypothetical protein
MSRLLFARLGAPALLALATVAAPLPAAAQYWGGWGGGWAPPPRVYVAAPADDFFGEDAVSPRTVARILNSRGYRLVSAPAYSGERVVAVGEAANGARARFYIDAYDGALIRMVRAGPQGDYASAPPADYGAPPLGAPGEPRAKPKPKPKPKSAARTPGDAKPAAPAAPPPSVATQPPAEPAPAIDQKPTAVAPPAPAVPAAPAASVPAPAPTPQATAPTPAPQTPLAPDARPAEQPSGKPVDIGPRVQPVARAPADQPAAAPAPDQPK